MTTPTPEPVEVSPDVPADQQGVTIFDPSDEPTEYETYVPQSGVDQ